MFCKFLTVNHVVWIFKKSNIISFGVMKNFTVRGEECHVSVPKLNEMFSEGLEKENQIPDREIGRIVKRVFPSVKRWKIRVE